MIGIRTFSDRKGSDLLFVRINKPIACFLFVLVIIYWYSHWMEDLPMSQPEHVYIAIDSKSFYASVECRERKLEMCIRDRRHVHRWGMVYCNTGRTGT